MTLRVQLLVAVVLVFTVACSSGPTESSATGTWVGSITTEGNITTVINESGSVWGGVATLVEEASIGVDLGDDPYMLGSVRAVAVHNSEIYILDQQIPTIRVYDLAGKHLRDVGSSGEGPGEFRRPDSLVIGPDGSLYVRDAQSGRISILSPEGGELGTMPLNQGFSTANRMVMTDDGVLHNYERTEADPETGERGRGMVPRLGADERGEPIVPPDFGFESWSLTANSTGMNLTTGVPFAPVMRWVLAPSGAVVAGVSDDYRFEIHSRDGRVMVVEKAWEPVSVDPAEADWRRKGSIETMRRVVPEWTWNGPEIPAVKPAYGQLLGDRSGCVWVIRSGPSTYEPECEVREGVSCWRSERLVDLFDVDGRYLGPVDIPADVSFTTRPFIRDDLFVATSTDALGTIMVKRYRLVLPGER